MYSNTSPNLYTLFTKNYVIFLILEFFENFFSKIFFENFFKNLVENFFENSFLKIFECLPFNLTNHVSPLYSVKVF